MIIGDVGKSVNPDGTNYLVPTPINKTVTEIVTRTLEATALRSSPNNTRATTTCGVDHCVDSLDSSSRSRTGRLWHFEWWVFVGFWILSGKRRGGVWEEIKVARFKLRIKPWQPLLFDIVMNCGLEPRDCSYQKEF